MQNGTIGFKSSSVESITGVTAMKGIINGVAVEGVVLYIDKDLGGAGSHAVILARSPRADLLSPADLPVDLEMVS